jgi:hypothetical protein
MSTKEEFGRRLEEARVAAGAPAYRSIEREAVVELGPASTPTAQTIGEMHKGNVSPEKAWLEFTLWLARRYGVTAESLSPVIAERANRVSDLLRIATGWMTLFDESFAA